MKTHTADFTVVIAAMLAATSLLAQEDNFVIPALPADLPQAQHAALAQNRVDLQHRSHSLDARIDKFNGDCHRVPEHSAKVAQCEQEQASIENAQKDLAQAIEKFKQALNAAVSAQALTSHVHALDTQIAEMEKQLRGLGFKNAVPDFTAIAARSEKAQQHMVNQLIARVREYASDISEDTMREHFLKYIRAMKKEEVKKVADFLQSKGADELLFQQWLSSFSPDASRANLVAGAQLAIDLVKGGESSFQINEELDKKTVQGRQEALLILISTVSDYPGMNELKLVASGAYDMLEAGVTICILDRGITDLTTATETQLASQKQIMLRMKNLVDERKTAREKLARF